MSPYVRRIRSRQKKVIRDIFFVVLAVCIVILFLSLFDSYQNRQASIGESKGLDVEALKKNKAQLEQQFNAGEFNVGQIDSIPQDKQEQLKRMVDQLKLR